MIIENNLHNLNNIISTQVIGDPAVALKKAWHSVKFINDEAKRTNQFKKELRRLANSGQFSCEDSAYFASWSLNIKSIRFNEPVAGFLMRVAPWVPLDPVDIHFSDGCQGILLL